MVRTSKTVFPCDCTILHSHQQCMRILVALYLCCNTNRYLMVSYYCFNLHFPDMKHFFISLFPICIFSYTHTHTHTHTYTADSDCSHEIKRRLLFGRKVMTNLHSIFKSINITLPTKVRLVKAMVFPVVMYGCESWTVKKAEH